MSRKTEMAGVFNIKIEWLNNKIQCHPAMMLAGVTKITIMNDFPSHSVIYSNDSTYVQTYCM